MAKGIDTGKDARRQVGRNMVNRMKVAPSFLMESGAVAGGLGTAVTAINTANRAAPGAGPFVAGIGMAAAVGGALALSARSVDHEVRKKRGMPTRRFYQAPSGIPSLFRPEAPQEAPTGETPTGETPTGGM